jgi:hypothetical protein
VTEPRTHSPTQLFVYSFGPDAHFEGQLAGAVERIEAGGALRVLEALLVQREPAGGLAVLDLEGRPGRGLTAPLLSFRLDPAARRRLTERALGGDSGGMRPDNLKELGDALEPGSALVALLVEHTWARALGDAVARIGGTALTDDFVDATALAELVPELLAASGTRGPEAP